MNGLYPSEGGFHAASGQIGPLSQLNYVAMPIKSGWSVQEPRRGPMSKAEARLKASRTTDPVPRAMPPLADPPPPPPPLGPVRLGGGPAVWCDLDYLLPSGSTKNRVARAVIDGAERRGELAPAGR